MSERVKQALPAIIGLVLFVLALFVLRRELHAVSWRELSGDILNTPVHQLVLAIVLTVINYAVLTGYDFLAFAYIGRKLSAIRIALASFLAYAIANNVGFAMLSGASVRYRFYSRWGVTAEELSRIVFSYSVTFWLGLLALGGFTLAFSPLPAAHELPAHELVAPVGWTLMLTVAAYLAATLVRREPLRLGRFVLPLPKPSIGFSQLVVSAVDWALAAAVLYVLLPPSDANFVVVLGAFLAAQLLGLASHVPGGVGVFEGLMVLLLKPYLTTAQILPALVVYRAVYYLLPLVIALVGLVADEVHQRRAQAARVGAMLGWLTEELTPRMIAVFTFIAGLVLLFSGATPAASGRLRMLHSLVPLGVIEASHFIGSLVGALLLVLSHGLARRLDAAYFAALGAIAIGIFASLFKGADYEEATFLSLLLLIMWRASPAFDRRAHFFEASFSWEWAAAIAGAFVATVWLGFFAFKHVEYSSELWWQFEVRGEASRFLRSSVGAAAVLFLFGVARLISPEPHEIDEPTDEDLADAARAIDQQTATYPNLVYLRDKGLLFNDDRSAFVMYGVQGRTWVALGDPIGPPGCMTDMIRLFLERSDDFDGVPVFYEISRHNLHAYADFGLTFVKLGEMAHVNLETFSLEGPRNKKLRQAAMRLDKQGSRFRLVAREEVHTIVDELQAVSDGWLKAKKAAEKGFSLGFFDREYVCRFPVGVIERVSDNAILAFASLWLGSSKHEMSLDLMRFRHDAPNGVMETLLANLMVWGKNEGYRWFELGMAPLSGFERSPVAPLWNRLGAFLYSHGETFYNFQGLRAYKEKFNPEWEPRYLAYPGGLRLARILADVSALIAGGYRRIFLK